MSLIIPGIVSISITRNASHGISTSHRAGLVMQPSAIPLSTSTRVSRSIPVISGLISTLCLHPASPSITCCRYRMCMLGADHARLTSDRRGVTGYHPLRFSAEGSQRYSSCATQLQKDHGLWLCQGIEGFSSRHLVCHQQCRIEHSWRPSAVMQSKL